MKMKKKKKRKEKKRIVKVLFLMGTDICSTLSLSFSLSLSLSLSQCNFTGRSGELNGREQKRSTRLDPAEIVFSLSEKEAPDGKGRTDSLIHSCVAKPPHQRLGKIIVC